MALLLGGWVLVGGCRTKPAERPAIATPVDPPAEDSPSAPVPVCANGVFLAQGKTLPREIVTYGVALAAAEREESIVVGACALDAALRACRVVGEGRSMVINLTIDAEGKVTSAKRESGSISEGEQARCIERVFAGATFPKQAAGDSSYRLAFATMTVSMIERGHRVGGIPEGEAYYALRTHFPRLRACYEGLMKRRNRDIDGVLTFDLVIRKDGTVSSLNVDFSDSFNDTELLQCSSKVVQAIVFPSPTGDEATIHYPLEFKTLREMD